MTIIANHGFESTSSIDDRVNCRDTPVGYQRGLKAAN